MKLYSLMLFFVLGSSYFFFNEDKVVELFPTATLTCTCDRAADSLILVAFHDALTESGIWINEWDFSTPIDEWWGIYLDENQNCVDTIKLRNNNLSGELIPEIGNLGGLKKLDLRAENISGVIPESIGSLCELDYLNLWETKVSGEIPSSIADLSQLSFLAIKSDFLQDTFPIEVFSLSNLYWLSLGGLSGEIPDNFESLVNLEGLELWDNDFTGDLPSSLGALPLLRQIDLKFNFSLSSSLPQSYINLNNLEVLEIIASGLNGSIPEGLGTLEHLRILDFQQNALTDTIPYSLGDLSNLEVLDLANNMLEGNIPNNFGDLTSLVDLNLGRNKLTGEIPASFNQLSNLESLFLSNNKLEGTVPDLSNLNLISLDVRRNFFDSIFNLNEISSWENSTGIRVNRNRFTFEDIIPYMNLSSFLDYYYPQDSVFKDTVIHITNLGQDISIDLGIDEGINSNVYTWHKNENIYSTIDSNTLWIPNVGVADIGIYNCTISNALAPDLILYSRNIELKFNLGCREADSLELVKLYNATTISENWTIPWDLQTSMDNWHGVMTNSSGCVEEIDLGNNNLNGEIPNLENLNSLKILLLWHNDLQGTLPSFESAQALEVLRLDDNPDLGGNVPDFSLPNLRIFTIENCSFDYIPNFSNLPSIEWIFGGYNNLSNEIPDFSACPLLVDLQLNDNFLTGEIPHYQQPFWILILGDNELEGEIPTDLQASQLFWLDVSNNNLEGAIPDLTAAPLLFALIVNGNNFNYLPDYSSVTSWGFQCTPPLECGLQIYNNNLSFDDIIPNMVAGNFGDWEYTPQDSFLTQREIFIPVGEQYTIELQIDSTISNNAYNWLKNGNSFFTGDENFLLINDLDELSSDTFHCQVTNPNVPNLTLYSRATIINVCQPLEADINQLLCDGESLTFNGTIYNQDSPEGTEYVDVPEEEGCDSIYHVQLDFYPRSEKNVMDTITQGSFIELAGVQYDSTGMYEIVLVGQGYTGCDSIILLDLTVEPAIVVLGNNFPNSFTPNGDGFNDYFVIPALQFNPQDFPNNEFTVFSRGSQVLFQAKPYNNDWDGRAEKGNVLPTGTYYYIFRYEENGQEVLLKGKILLNR
ncbi:MAG: gliding motility-associated-like protein [Saprospiraceae bacterium]|jgi:gliding motility-associated-like protein